MGRYAYQHVITLPVESSSEALDQVKQRIDSLRQEDLTSDQGVWQIRNLSESIRYEELRRIGKQRGDQAYEAAKAKQPTLQRLMGRYPDNVRWERPTLSDVDPVTDEEIRAELRSKYLPVFEDILRFSQVKEIEGTLVIFQSSVEMDIYPEEDVVIESFASLEVFPPGTTVEGGFHAKV